ncbi:MAG: type 4a pilus biogenesis protein PilO [Deinococcales bacterium]|nr:type 4a pilus biogenesis protein PilO [Deinococcales bacterium]
MTSRGFDLRRLRQRDIAIIMIVLSLLLAVLWFFYMYQPTQERISTLESDIARLDVDIRRGEDARRNLPDLRLAVAQLEQDRLDFLAQLPRESDVAGLIDALRVSAIDSDMLVNGFSQGSASESIQDVRPIGFQIGLQGTFQQTMAFLGRLEEMQRFAKIQRVGLNLDDNTSADPLINSDFGFTVYVYTGSDPGEQ